MEHKKRSGVFLIILAGVFWGSMGLFVRKLNAFGFSSLNIAFLRLGVGAVIFSLILFFTDRNGFKISVRDIPLFLGLGICSVMLFTVCYFKAIELMPLSVAAILLYTSPIWVTLMSCAVFGEKLTVKKLSALVLAFAGCVLVSGIGGGMHLSMKGLALGLCSGVCYALYSILGTFALRKYKALTVTTYTFIISSLACLLFFRAGDMAALIRSAPSSSLLILIPATAVITAVIPYLSYTVGLQTTEAGKAAILATVEPVVATVFGIVVYHETLSFTSLFGILLVLSAIVLLNIKTQ